MQRNLDQPLAEILALAAEQGLRPAPIRTALRTGDTSSSQRAAILRRPPHLLITTPESLYLMLTSSKARDTLRSVNTLIVDEIHAMVRDKRGSHLALTMERLQALCSQPIQRIGLSATQRPMDEIARFLTGVAIPSVIDETADAKEQHVEDRDVVRLDIGHQRTLDLSIEVPPSELGAVCMHEQWAEINVRIAELVSTHRSTMIFVNTRRMAERLTHQLSELLGEESVCSHHGSLSYAHRSTTEQRLKSGQLKAVVATASLEMGIDIGSVDLVIQIGSPRSISAFLQRIGRSGHALGLIPKGRLFALTRDELLECMALMRGIRSGNLDIVPIPEAPLDILAQQIVAEVACREWSTDELFAMVRRAGPYRRLRRSEFDDVVRILSEGLCPTQVRSRVFLHHDQVRRQLRARPGARMAAISNAGAIPDVFAIRVILEDEQTVVGTVDEEFATESQAGDVFLLGNNSWQIRYLRGGDLTVGDAHGAPPTIPFWRGEAPGRTYELSEEVSRLREDLEPLLHDAEQAAAWLSEETCAPPAAARQAVEYVSAQKAAIGLIPTMRRVVFERFFDESGGMQLVIHAPFGTRITRAWGLAMRKRFCRSFDFELQANADDDGIVLSLGPQHSFPLESMFSMLNERNVQQMFEQAVLAVPIFTNRWRWNATRALQVPRTRNGKKVPPALQRFRSEDLLTAVFPKLTGCQENVVGDIELPDDPLVRQTMYDCLQEAHDMLRLKEILAAVELGEIEFLARDTREPSPFSYELLNSNPYAFLDGGEVAERRARAVSTRRSLTADSVEDLGRLDPEAIRQVVQEAQPLVRNADELHDLLLGRIILPIEEVPAGELSWERFFAELLKDGRAATATVGRHDLDSGSVVIPAQAGIQCRNLDSHLRGNDGTPESSVEDADDTVVLSAPHVPQRTYWVATERMPVLLAAFPDAVVQPVVTVPAGVRVDWEMTDARVAMVRGLLETCGPITAADAAERIGITVSQTDAALEALEGEGVVLRGRFTVPAFTAGAPASPPPEKDVNSEIAPDTVVMEWCHRRLLARIHRLTMDGLRKQIQPVDVTTLMRFLIRHQGADDGYRRSGTNGLFEVVGQLQGIDISVAAWERDVLPLRLQDYSPAWLDELCLSGEVAWGRLYPPVRNPDKSRPITSLTRAAPISLFLREDRSWLLPETVTAPPEGLSSPATHVVELLAVRGAMFATDLQAASGMLRDHLEEALGELVSRGLVTADGFAGLRSLIVDRTSQKRSSRRVQPRRVRTVAASPGRWSLTVQPPQVSLVDSSENPSRLPAVMSSENSATEEWAWQLLRRWGVVFRDLLVCETGAPSWYALLQVLRRLEARGEIRGGRFVSGVAGEQFATAESVQQLRLMRDEIPSSDYIVISAADPLNLVGVLTPHERIPRIAGSRIVLRAGVPVSSIHGGEIRSFPNVPAEWIAEALPYLSERVVQRS